MKSIFLLSSRTDDVGLLTRAALSAGATLEVFTQAEKAVDQIRAHKPCAIFIDVDEQDLLSSYEKSVQSRYGFFSDLVHPHLTHFLSSSPLNQKRDLIQSPFFGNFVERPPAAEADRFAECYGRFVNFISIESGHDLSVLLGPKAKIQEAVLSKTSQKYEVVEAIRKYLLTARAPARITNVIANAIDEIVMNALYDAPIDEFGKTLYSATLRSQDRMLNEREKVKIRFGFDGFQFGICVVDQFGSLDRQRLLNHVSLNYRDQNYQIKVGQVGAGLGLATIFSTGGTLIYLAEPKVKTEVYLLYKLYPSYRSFKSQFKFFSSRFGL